jgi:hypothetical protein
MQSNSEKAAEKRYCEAHGVLGCPFCMSQKWQPIVNQEEAATVELAKPIQTKGLSEEAQFFRYNDIAAERERWQAKVIDADKSGYRAASQERCARYARAKKEFGRRYKGEGW